LGVVFDMGADDCRASSSGLPAIEECSQTVANLLQIGKLSLEVGRFAAHEVADVWAGGAARPFDGDDLLDLLQREAEPPRPRDETEKRERVVAVDPVARRRPTRLA